VESRIFKTLRAVALSVIVLGAQQLAKADDFGYLDEAVKNAIKAANAEQNNNGQIGYSAALESLCMLGAMIDRGGYSALTFNYSLLPGKSYLFIAAGDNDLTGLELTCKNKGAEKPFDTKKGAVAVSYVRIPAGQDRAKVQVAVKVTASKDPPDFVVILCLENTGTPSDLDALESRVSYLATAIARNSDKGKFAPDEGHDDICFYAMHLTGDSPEREFYRIFRTGTHYKLYSTGDMNCKNIEASVFKRNDDGSNGEQVGRNTAPVGADSIVEFDAGTSDDWKGNIHINTDGLEDPSKPSLVVTAIVVKQ
jgi:hypothetical protein